MSQAKLGKLGIRSEELGIIREKQFNNIQTNKK